MWWVICSCRIFLKYLYPHWYTIFQSGFRVVFSYFFEPVLCDEKLHQTCFLVSFTIVLSSTLSLSSFIFYLGLNLTREVQDDMFLYSVKKQILPHQRPGLTTFIPPIRHGSFKRKRQRYSFTFIGIYHPCYFLRPFQLVLLSYNSNSARGS